MKKFDLEDRFIDYSIRMSNVVDKIDNSKLGTYLAGQLIRSSSSPALNYGEAQSAESRKDFVHKLKIILKELKESRICLKIIERKPLIQNTNKLAQVMKETEELIAIVYKSIETTKANMQK
ncbi:MAG: four helix bundle protein [Bacteroidetes bacterium]|jgi:four helix bundle protein|nr:four helix bundle protein [Bacteroidota bacterium]MBT6686063.1 four helix bundle protein [Bacteroidota bacterium]MBT7144307.1 four helix bundle protein [Bacteroidota bacterium]MBT7490380.1 four helix bundle protein [Bacteroidota bacterium]